MAQSAAHELDSILQSLQSLKPPGVNKAKVDAATRLCTDFQNIPVCIFATMASFDSDLSLQIEHVLVDVLSAGFRRSPVTHKLGVLYIIDSIARQWVAAGAAHAGGLRRMTDSLPALMNELIPVTPDTQKVSS
jgi:protein NRD1